jgi:hypothetical protein
MSPSNPVIRRYTPPTCTLEILAQNSPLSHWTEKTVINNLSFSLHFDDPRLPEEQRILVQGDREQLELLCNMVTTYVQKLLQQSVEDFRINLSETNNSNTESESEFQEIPLSVFPTQNLQSFNSETPQTNIYLEPSHNLTHKLFLGDLAKETSAKAIELSLLQLFDLATALDEYSSDIVVLPTTSNQPVRASLPQWTPIAAILVLAASLTPFTWQYANNVQKSRQQVAKSTPESLEPVTIEPSLQDTVPTPSLNLTTPQSPNLTTPQSSLTPPPPNLSTPSAPLSFPNATIPAAPTTTSQPPLAIPSDVFSAPTPQTSLRENSSSGVKKETNDIKPKNSPFGKSEISSGFSQPSQSGGTTSNNTFGNIPNTLSRSSELKLPQGIVESTTPSQPSPAQKQENLVRRLKAGTTTTSGTQTTKDNTLFDTVQVAEARTYLNQRWQPPTGLSQALEYSLTLSLDGKIERILPLNQAARKYIDSSGIPEIGKPFVSTNKFGQNVRIRVILTPDSKVQTFPETP